MDLFALHDYLSSINKLLGIHSDFFHEISEESKNKMRKSTFFLIFYSEDLNVLWLNMNYDWRKLMIVKPFCLFPNTVICSWSQAMSVNCKTSAKTNTYNYGLQLTNWIINENWKEWKETKNCNSYTVCITECGNKKLNSNINMNF